MPKTALRGMFFPAEKIRTGESPTVYTPDLLVFDTPEKVGEYATGEIIALLRAKPEAVLTLPTGATPKEMYRLLRRVYWLGKRVTFARATIFNVDEYWPIDPKHPASYHSYMRSNLIERINIPSTNWHIPNGAATNPQEEAERFEALLHHAGTVDLAILGIGPGLTCHIGFNEPGSPVDCRTRYVKFDPTTKEANKKYFPNPEEMPDGAITLGIANILEAERIILLANGEAKATGLARALLGEISAAAPASFLRYHPNVVFALDAQAAIALPTAVQRNQ